VIFAEKPVAALVTGRSSTIKR